MEFTFIDISSGNNQNNQTHSASRVNESEATFFLDGEPCGPRTELWSAYVESAEEISFVAQMSLWLRCSFRNWDSEKLVVITYKKTGTNPSWQIDQSIHHSFAQDFRVCPQELKNVAYIIEIASSNGTTLARTPILKPFTERWFREKLKRTQLEPVKSLPIGKYTSELLTAYSKIKELTRINHNLQKQLEQTMQECHMLREENNKLQSQNNYWSQVFSGFIDNVSVEDLQHLQNASDSVLDSMFSELSSPTSSSSPQYDSSDLSDYSDLKHSPSFTTSASTTNYSIPQSSAPWTTPPPQAQSFLPQSNVQYDLPPQQYSYAPPPVVSPIPPAAPPAYNPPPPNRIMKAMPPKESPSEPVKKHSAVQLKAFHPVAPHLGAVPPPTSSVYKQSATVPAPSRRSSSSMSARSGEKKEKEKQSIDATSLFRVKAKKSSAKENNKDKKTSTRKREAYDEKIQQDDEENEDHEDDGGSRHAMEPAAMDKMESEEANFIMNEEEEALQDIIAQISLNEAQESKAKAPNFQDFTGNKTRDSEPQTWSEAEKAPPKIVAVSGSLNEDKKKKKKGRKIPEELILLCKVEFNLMKFQGGQLVPSNPVSGVHQFSDTDMTGVSISNHYNIPIYVILHHHDTSGTIHTINPEPEEGTMLRLDTLDQDPHKYSSKNLLGSFSGAGVHIIKLLVTTDCTQWKKDNPALAEALALSAPSQPQECILEQKFTITTSSVQQQLSVPQEVKSETGVVAAPTLAGFSPLGQLISLDKWQAIQHKILHPDPPAAPSLPDDDVNLLEL